MFMLYIYLTALQKLHALK